MSSDVILLIQPLVRCSNDAKRLVFFVVVEAGKRTNELRPRVFSHCELEPELESVAHFGRLEFESID